MYHNKLIPAFYNDVKLYIRPYKKVPQIIHVCPLNNGYKQYAMAETLEVYNLI